MCVSNCALCFFRFTTTTQQTSGLDFIFLLARSFQFRKVVYCTSPRVAAPLGKLLLEFLGKPHLLSLAHLHTTSLSPWDGPSIDSSSPACLPAPSLHFNLTRLRPRPRPRPRHVLCAPDSLGKPRTQFAFLSVPCGRWVLRLRVSRLSAAVRITCNRRWLRNLTRAHRNSVWTYLPRCTGLGLCYRVYCRYQDTTPTCNKSSRRLEFD